MWRCEGKRARGQEEKMWRCEDVKMWRCEDEQMWRCEDEQMWRWEDVKMWRWEDVKMRRCEDEKVWKCEDVNMWRCEDEQMRRWEDVKMRRWEDLKMRRCEDVKIGKCEDERMWGWEGKMWRGEDVRTRKCEDEKMWRWEDVKTRRCEDEKMWRWEDVKMRRWDTDPHYWKNPALRRSREKHVPIPRHSPTEEKPLEGIQQRCKNWRCRRQAKDSGLVPVRRTMLAWACLLFPVQRQSVSWSCVAAGTKWNCFRHSKTIQENDKFRHCRMPRSFLWAFIFFVPALLQPRFTSNCPEKSRIVAPAERDARKFTSWRGFRSCTAQASDLKRICKVLKCSKHF